MQPIIEAQLSKEEENFYQKLIQMFPPVLRDVDKHLLRKTSMHPYLPIKVKFT